MHARPAALTALAVGAALALAPAATAQQGLGPLTYTKHVKTSAALRYGITIRLSAPAAGKLSGSATVTSVTAHKYKLEDKTVAKGSTIVHAPATTSVRLRFTKDAAKHLTDAHKVPLTITLQLGTLTGSAKITLT